MESNMPFPSEHMDLMVAGRGCEWLDSSSLEIIGEMLDAVCTLTHVAEGILLSPRGDVPAVGRK